jgi:hypothetical protein
MVHHRDYEKDTLLGKRIDGMSAICETCHKSIEFIAGVKTSLSQANEALRNLSRAAGIAPAGEDLANTIRTRRQRKRKTRREKRHKRTGLPKLPPLPPRQPLPQPAPITDPEELAYRTRVDAAKRMPRRNPEQEAARSFRLDQLHRERLAKTRILA